MKPYITFRDLKRKHCETITRLKKTVFENSNSCDNKIRLFNDRISEVGYNGNGEVKTQKSWKSINKNSLMIGLKKELNLLNK
jgi:hypothetical protein